MNQITHLVVKLSHKNDGSSIFFFFLGGLKKPQRRRRRKEGRKEEECSACLLFQKKEYCGKITNSTGDTALHGRSDYKRVPPLTCTLIDVDIYGSISLNKRDLKIKYTHRAITKI